MRDFPCLQEAIGYVMEKILFERKMTKLRLADFSGIQDSYIRAIAKGGRNPSIGAIYAICEALGVSLIEFLEKVESWRRELLRDGEDKKIGGWVPGWGGWCNSTIRCYGLAWFKH